MTIETLRKVFYLKKQSIFGVAIHDVVLVKTFPLMYQLLM